ncbi:MAG: protein TolR [Gammaproteobacteria bacterium]|jgi:biopolymer transport protein TolR|nr:protein TolR [Gammaproteobacteria bacterium]MBT3490347.1 protein TolR [Gammaproteobacteria bacterium]MBT3718204.1 protein TolR [Gammaproteobacteria bacterium]MBT3846208.1 protein TolR [Gammaproteobacteria bacterium]MBT3893388.1 protein TolR [Gammaproteobacteria bacterium]
MSRQQRSRKRPIASINVVPYIDVMLVLLIIFMVTAPLLTQGVQVELPQTDARVVENSNQEPVVVTVQRDGRLYLNVGDHPEQSVEPQQIQRRVSLLIQKNPETQVLVRGDHQVQYGAVVSVMALLQQTGLPSVGLVTDPPEQ